MPPGEFPVSSDMRALTVLCVSLLPGAWIRMAFIGHRQAFNVVHAGSPQKGAERSCFFSISSTMIPATVCVGQYDAAAPSNGHTLIAFR